MAYSGPPRDSGGGNDERPVTTSGLKERVTKIKKAHTAAFNAQARYLPLWQVQAELFNPLRADFTTQYSDGLERYDGLHTSAPAMMARDMANQLGAMVRPRGKSWFNLTLQNKSKLTDDVKAWCKFGTDTQRSLIYERQAKFTSSMRGSDLDYVVFGNSVVVNGYRSDMSGMRYECLHLKDTAWSKNAEGEADTLHARRMWPLSHVVKWFGEDALPQEWSRMWGKPEQRETKVKVCFTVKPIDETAYEPKEKRPKFASYCQLFWAGDIENDCELGERFLLAQCFTVREWMSLSGEDYARSPCTSVALADARTLNVAEEALLTSVEQAVRPAKLVRDGIVLSELDFRSNTVTFVDAEYDSRYGDPVVSVDQGDPRYAMDFTQRMEDRQGMAFFQNLLKIPQGHEMTAYEAAERIEEYVRNAAPIFEPMEAENAHLMDCTFERAWHKGAFGSIDDAPDEVKSSPTQFEFETPLSDALRKQKAAQWDAMVASASALVGMQHPHALAAVDNFDFDSATRDGMEGKFPSTWLRKTEERDEMRGAAAQQAEAEKAKEDAMNVADMALNSNPENLRRTTEALEQ